MLNFQQLIEDEYKSAYESAYDLTLKEQYSEPKIYNANNDLSKRWYVYFSYRNPKTGKLTRQTPVYGNANSYKTKEERLAVLTIYRRVLLKLLKQGYSPYEDNTELHTKLHTESKKPNIQPKMQPNRFLNVDKVANNGLNTVNISVADNKNKETNTQNEQTNNESKQTITKVVSGTATEGQTVNTIKQTINIKNKTTVEDAFKLDANIKQKSLRQTSYRSYSSHLNRFMIWLQKEQKKLKYIEEVDKAVVNMFLNKVLLESSARNRNNYKASISSFYSTLVDNDILKTNEIVSIKKLKTNSVRNKTYNEEQQKEIFDYLEKADPTLLLFIKFVSYNFLRPIEVCRLKVGDINIKTKQISFRAKNKALKTKIIPSILLDDLPDLSQFKEDEDLFNYNGYGGYWEATDDTKRGTFSNRFKTIVKDKFKLGKEYGLYSFRHTFITKLYKALKENSSPHETKSQLMQITGHTSMAALEAYLRDIDVELPEDYSDLLKD